MDKNELLDGLAQALIERAGAQYKHDLPANFTLSTNLMHGPTGIFGTAGAGPDVFSTRIKPRGLLSALPAMPTVDENPIVYYLTGFTAGSGSEPSTPCAECKKPGNMKTCRQGAVFGMICRETDELDLSALGQHVNRGEFFDLRLINDPLLNDAPMWVPPSVPKEASIALNSEVMARWLTLGVEFEQTLARILWGGSPLNNVGTGYAEPLGIQSLVKTGHTDVINQTSCPSLDSDIKDFKYGQVENDAAGLFRLLTAMWRYVTHNAENMGFMPVQWAFVMRDSLFRVISDLWPCVFASFGCGATALQLQNNTDAMAMRQLASDMYNGRYLEIDHIRIPVLIDDAVPQQESPTAGLPPGSFASDIYLLPFTVRGGVPVLFAEYFDFSARNAAIDSAVQGKLGDFYWTDGGKWLWTFSQTKWCVNWSAKIKPRFRLLTPHLAGRLMRIRWTPIQEFRQPFNTDPYFVDGGNYTASNAPYTITS
jgi:hypothetical protein